MEKIIIQEVGVSVIKGAVGAIPFVGTALNECIFDCRGRVKQDRVNRFIEELTIYMTSVSENQINFDYIKSEEFGDVVESIMKRIVYNKSEEKMHRFKKILVKEMMAPSFSDYSETFLDIISNINEKQIEILDNYRKIENGELTSDENLADRNVLDANKEINSDAYLSHNYYNLDKSTYNFYVQDLISKSLLIDDSMNRYSTRPLTILKITQFGIEFLRFIHGN
jgi:hypothetical protein